MVPTQQGDQIERILAFWAISTLGSFFYLKK
jgi:hypothetical protein